MTSSSPRHDTECEIDSGAIGFDWIACLCEGRAKTTYEPDWKPVPVKKPKKKGK